MCIELSSHIDYDVFFLSVNSRSLLRNGLELSHILELHDPDIVLLQETWLNASIENYVLENYKCISRLDRVDERQGGGIRPKEK